MAEPTCRICFSGQDASARLISPCKCKGTMKYVHVDCLNEWRRVSANTHSFFECDQCKYKYQFTRTFLADMLCNNITISILTLCAFTFIAFISGFVMKMLLRYSSTPDLPLSYSSDDWIDQLLLYLDYDKDLSYTTINWIHFVLGSILVGLISTLQLFYYLSSPFGGIFGRRGRRDNLSGYVMLGLVLIGIYKVSVKLYRIVNNWSKRQVERFSSVILNVD